MTTKQFKQDIDGSEESIKRYNMAKLYGNPYKEAIISLQQQILGLAQMVEKNPMGLHPITSQPFAEILEAYIDEINRYVQIDLHHLHNVCLGIQEKYHNTINIKIINNAKLSSKLILKKQVGYNSIDDESAEYLANIDYLNIPELIKVFEHVSTLPVYGYFGLL